MMLSHLFIHGPTFEEVFRKPPSIKVHRVLQDRLDRGKDFDFNKVNACEMSHLLKVRLQSMTTIYNITQSNSSNLCNNNYNTINKGNSSNMCNEQLQKASF